MYKGSPAPHGGKLTVRLSSDAARASAAAKLPSIPLSSRSLADVEMLAIGAYSPLTGFMNSKDYRAVIEKTRLANGLVWSIPVVLGVSESEAAALKEGSDVA